MGVSGRRRDGTTFPAEISLSTLGTGQDILVSATIRDAAQQRQTLDDLRRTNQNLQQLGYAIAHDLRSPLRSLAGFSAALIEDYADVLGKDGRNHAQRIEAASRHIGQVLDDLMDLSRVARAEISLQPVNLGAEAATIATELQRQDPARSVRFTIQPQAWVLADRALIREALRHLLGNAAWAEGTVGDGATFFFTLQAAEPAGATGGVLAG